MKQSDDEWYREYAVLAEALGRHASRLPNPYSPGPHRPLAEAERVFSDLLYYWNAAIINNGDVFGYMRFIIPHRQDFAAIGAHKTLDAMAKLMPFYEEQQRLSDDEQGAYWWRTKDERAPFESLAEGVHEFGRLLLAYADKHFSEGRGATFEPQSP